MKILIVSLTDDNFGDVLIKISFRALLQTVLDNIGVSETEYSLRFMGLKSIDSEEVESSDMICFAGGGLFGLSYLDFYRYFKEIICIAEANQIPVVLSSLGINNMDASAENDEELKSVLSQSCIRAISVRENVELFNHFLEDVNLSAKQVCDPAVWARYIYAKQIEDIGETKGSDDKPLIGLNVIRSGIFKENGTDWKFADELAFWNDIRIMLEEQGYDYRFYTNGSTLDNNALFALADLYEIPFSKMIFVDSTAELIQTLSQFDAVIAIRMHSSIISYSLGIPVVNLSWNPKVPLFYQAIGRPENAVAFEDWNAQTVWQRLRQMADESGRFSKMPLDESYLMSVYQYLYDIFAEVFSANERKPMYGFEQVCEYISNRSMFSSEDDVDDMKFKLYQGERRYYILFKNIRDKNEQLKTVKKQLAASTKKATKLAETVKEQKETIKQNEKTIRYLSNRVEKFENLFIIKISLRIHRFFKKLKSKE